MKGSSRRQPKTKEEVKSTSLDSGFLSGMNSTCSSSNVDEVRPDKKQISCEVDSGLGIDYYSPSTSTFSDLSLTADDNKCSDKGGVDSGLAITFSKCDLNEPEELDEVSNNNNRIQQALKNAEDFNKECSKSLSPSVYFAFLNEAYQQDKDGDTRLHLSVTVERLDLVFSLIFLAPQTHYLDIQNNQSQTALHLAVLTNQPNIVRPLVLAGTNLMLRDHHGNTPLHLACRNGFLECAKQLTREITLLEEQYIGVTSPSHLPPRKPPVLPSPSTIIDTCNYQGRSCVHLAAINQHTDILLWLKKCGANIDAKESCGGRTSITFAVESRDANMVNFLVKECSANVNMENFAGQTAYQIAYQNDRKIADQLRTLGAQTFYDDDGGDQFLDSEDEDGETMDTCSAAVQSQTPPSPPLQSQNEGERNRNFYDLKINGEPLW